MREAGRASRAVEQSTHQSASQPTDRLTRQSTGPSTSRPAGRLTDGLDSKPVDRPKSFYITVRIDHLIDEAVRYLRAEHGITKVDRSTVVNAMLESEAQWSSKALDRLVSRVMKHLTNRLTKP